MSLKRISFSICMTTALGSVTLFDPFLIGSAHAVGVVKLESNGFLRTATDRPDSTQTLSIGPRGKTESKYIATEMDLQANLQMGDRSTFTPEAKNLYIATSPRLSRNHQVSFGRRTEDWSTADDAWEMGMYSPRFIWDPTRPQKVGLTGALYQHRSKNIVASVMGTGIDIPERGFPVREENGRMVSSNPFAVHLYEYAEYQGSFIPIRYNVNYPPIKELIVNPGGVARVRVQADEKRGLWLQASGGYLPIHQPYLSIEDNQIYNPTENIANIQVHPSIQYHRLLTVEAGLKGRRFSLWGSLTREDTERRRQRPNTVSAKMEDAVIASTGGEAQLTRHLKVYASFLHIAEDPTPAPLQKPLVNVDLQGRYTYKRGVRAGLELVGRGRMSYSARWIYDLAGESHLASADTYVTLLRQSRDLTLNLGADFFISATGTGTLGQFKGNDRVRGGISYVF